MVSCGPVFTLQKGSQGREAFARVGDVGLLINDPLRYMRRRFNPQTRQDGTQL